METENRSPISSQQKPFYRKKWVFLIGYFLIALILAIIASKLAGDVSFGILIILISIVIAVKIGLSSNEGNSLWNDAWKRLLKNKLAIFGLIVMGIMVVAVTIGPAIIKWTTGYTYDFIPPDSKLVNSFPPSFEHPMGTDDAGRDILARVLQGGRISLMVGLISTLVSLIVGVSYGATAGYLGGKIDNVMMRFVDILYSIPYILIVIVLRTGRKVLNSIFLSGTVMPRFCFHCACTNSASCRLDSPVL